MRAAASLVLPAGSQLPTHASWLNQIEIVFRQDLAELIARLDAHEPDIRRAA